jgi:hypothetical protein
MKTLKRIATAVNGERCFFGYSVRGYEVLVYSLCAIIGTLILPFALVVYLSPLSHWITLLMGVSSGIVLVALMSDLLMALVGDITGRAPNGTRPRRLAIRAFLFFLFAVRSMTGRRAVRVPVVSAPPGWQLHRFAQLVFSRRTFETVLQPVLSDLQIEFCEALREGRPFKARWKQVCGYGIFWCHVGAQLPVSLIKTFVKIWTFIG